MSLLVERDGEVTVLTLDRAEKRNALSLELREQLAAALRRAGGEAGAVVIAARGPVFCAGMDVSQFGGDHANRERIVASSTELFRALIECPVPVIAAVQGPALAGGFALALLCDLRVAGSDASFGFVEVARGIPAGYAAARAVLPRGPARELALTGRQIDAREALDLGIVGDVVLDPAAQAVALAHGLASQPRGVTRATKARFRLEDELVLVPLLEREEQELRQALLSAA